MQPLVAKISKVLLVSDSCLSYTKLRNQEESIMTQLAQQIRALRTAKNLSQDGLAEKLYISRQAISKWENGVSQS